MSALLAACCVAAIVSHSALDALGGVRSTVLSVPDVDADGLSEAAVFHWERSGRSILSLRGGSDGTVLWNQDLSGSFRAMTTISEAGEEGRIVVAMQPSNLRAYDSSTGEPGWAAGIESGQHEQVTNLVTVPDLDEDGIQDLLVSLGHRYPGRGGSLCLLSGASGLVLAVWELFEIDGLQVHPTSAFGVRFEPDGRSSTEISIAIRDPGTEEGHAIAILDLRTRKIRRLHAMPDAMWLIRDVGDFDGDGVRDHAVTHESWWLEILSGVDGSPLHRRGFGLGELWNRASTLAVLREPCDGLGPRIVYDGSHIGFIKDESGRTLQGGDCERTLWWGHLEEVADLGLGEEYEECVDLATWRHPKDPRLDAILIHLQLQKRLLLVEGVTGRVRWDRTIECD